MNTDDEVVLPLISALSERRDGLRQFAIRRLVNLGPRAIPALLTTLKSEDAHVQESAAIALSTMGLVAVPHLMQAMRSPDRKLCWAASWVLSSMPPEVRQAIPKVTLPTRESEPRQLPKAPESGMHGVWSDSWLTKVRERLEAGKHDISGLSPSLWST
jgi:hypothetical protein